VCALGPNLKVSVGWASFLEEFPEHEPRLNQINHDLKLLLDPGSHFWTCWWALGLLMGYWVSLLEEFPENELRLNQISHDLKLPLSYLAFTRHTCRKRGGGFRSRLSLFSVA
jgi:hypothetical protein